MKSTWRELAVMGGPCGFDRPLFVGRPNLGDQKGFLDRMERILASRQLSNNGPFVQEFEARIARFIGVRNCIATCNATLGLELAISALGMTGSVILPSFTFIATAHALERNGVTLLFCDVDPDTHNIDPAAIEALIRPDTSGILGVHLWAAACPVDTIDALARKHGLRLLFDAAHAPGVSRASQSRQRGGIHDPRAG
jgi:dTDP-4-amino-4,6-dideoxygalactose transaminase